MRRLVRSVGLALAGVGLCVGLANAGAADPVAGDWSTGGRTVVRIGPCAGAPARMCGVIVAMANGRDGRPLLDSQNPDPKLKTRALVGLPLIFGFRSAGGGRWADGKIYNPDDGKTYDAKLEPGPGGTLRVSGCVLFLCKAQTWRRPT